MRVERRGDFIDIDIGGNIEHVLKIAEALQLARWIIELAPDQRESGRERATCHDCGALEGELHELGCDMERCPFCGHQLISCACRYDLLGLRNGLRYTAETNFIQPEVYEHGLDDRQQARWLEILNKKGRIPWIQYPNVCPKCGALWPDMFMVPNEEWERYVEPAV